jgi:hypothetical protein
MRPAIRRHLVHQGNRPPPPRFRFSLVTLVLPGLALMSGCDLSSTTDPVEPSMFSASFTASAAGCLLAPSGLVRWWPGDGNADEVVAGNHGTLSGGVGFATGKVGEAFSFDGVDGFMDIGMPLSVSAGTVGFWVNRQGLTGSDVFMGSVDLNALPNRAPTLFVRSGGTLLWEFGNLTGRNTGVALPTGTWHHVAMTWQQNLDLTHSVAVYLNGASVASGTASGVTGFTDLTVGAYRTTTTTEQFAHALIDEVMIYDRALDAWEIQATVAADCMRLNTAPSVTSILGLPVEPIPVGTSVGALVSFTDPDAGDAHSTSIDWGDGTVTAGVGQVFEAPNGSFEGSHAYTAAGIYTVTVTVDDGTASDSESHAYVVVYDPDAGFVTGGGWIDVAPGSYIPAPHATGAARFGFVSRYRRGQTRPDGNTQFHFQAAGLQFRSTAYEWLVVAGARAQYKGEGTVNGDPGFCFMLTAIDSSINGGGTVDRLRLKVWMCADDTLVFDNQLGASDDAEPTTAITRGNIVIHR